MALSAVADSMKSGFVAVMLRLLAILLFYINVAHASSGKILYVIPNISEYWHNSTIPMMAAAKQLNLDLTVKVITGRDSYDAELLQHLDTHSKPDWLIWSQSRFSTQKILDRLEKDNIKSVDITSGLFADSYKKVGYPQQHYKHWKAQVLSDEFAGGQHLILGLLQQAKKQSKGQPINFIALAGEKNVATVFDNVAGMQSAISQNKQAALLQLVHSNWTKESAQLMTQQLFSRYQQVDAVWVASTTMALGVIEQVNKMAKKPQANPIIANIGWTAEIFDTIKKGKIAFSLGANHLNGLWALILIHDMQHGIVLLTTPESTRFKSAYVRADKDNVALLEPFLTAERWQQVDIKQYSKVYNPQLKDYNFDFSLLLK